VNRVLALDDSSEAASSPVTLRSSRPSSKVHRMLPVLQTAGVSRTCKCSLWPRVSLSPTPPPSPLDLQKRGSPLNKPLLLLLKAALDTKKSEAPGDVDVASECRELFREWDRESEARDPHGHVLAGIAVTPRDKQASPALQYCSVRLLSLSVLSCLTHRMSVCYLSTFEFAACGVRRFSVFLL
jgi:hypothetical protein